MKTFECLTCKQHFMAYNLSNGNPRQFCSMNCYSAMYSTKKQCEKCGSVFHVSNAEIRRGGGKYCSRACYFSGKTKPIYERFKRYFTESVDGCWLWFGSKNNMGYGIIGTKAGKPAEFAHRVSYRNYVGEIPDGMCVLHKCDVPLCIRPDHLFLGTTKDNIHDMLNKNRGRWRNHTAKSHEVFLAEYRVKNRARYYKNRSIILREQRISYRKNKHIIAASRLAKEEAQHCVWGIN